jgi:hypothetical protein
MKGFSSSSFIAFTLASSPLVDSLVAAQVCDGADQSSSSSRALPCDTTETDPWFLTENARSHLGNYDDFWDEIKCDEVFEEGGPRPIYSSVTWSFLRGVYYGIVGRQQSTIKYRDLPIDGTGVLVKVRVEHLPGKGRAVIAAEDIPKGTRIWASTFTARFPSPMYFRRYLATLPKELACDVMIWAYAEDFEWEEGGVRATLSVDLDEGTFFNTVNTTNGEEKNIRYDPWEATRLILKGEELLVDYSDFEKQFSWSAAGFGSEEESDVTWAI